MQKTISSILWAKFLDTLDRSSGLDIFLFLVKLFSWSIISVALINIPDALKNLTTAILWHDMAIIKVSVAFVLVFFYHRIYLMAKIIWSIFPELPKMPVHGPQYFGIPVIELVDYIFTAPSYSRTEFCEHFGVARKVFDDLASGLDTVKVFVRGQNNARTLSSEFSRADISSILSRACDTWEIRPLIRKTDTGYTHTPSMAEIIERSHSPSHGFTTRILSSNTMPA